MTSQSTSCWCTLPWCAATQENREHRKFTVPRIVASKWNIKNRQKQEERDRVLGVLRPNGKELNYRTPAQFLWWHLSPESFFWKTEADYDRRAKNKQVGWAVRFLHVSSERTVPPPHGIPAAWNGAEWMPIQDETASKALLELGSSVRINDQLEEEHVGQVGEKRIRRQDEGDRPTKRQERHPQADRRIEEEIGEEEVGNKEQQDEMHQLEWDPNLDDLNSMLERGNSGLEERDSQ